MIPALCEILRSYEARVAFTRAGGVRILINLIKAVGANGDAQQLYNFVFCLWTLSLPLGLVHQTECLSQLEPFLQCGALHSLCGLVAAPPSKKVLRVTLATLRNISLTEHEIILNEMLNHGLLKTIDNMVATGVIKQHGDCDIEQDARALFELMNRNFKELSSFQKWVSEVQSGYLRWSVGNPHKIM